MSAEYAYISIDLKSFYASVECMERGLNPMTANLVVADQSRTEKTICLAVSPSLKAYGISGRARLFEVVEKVRQVNARRRALAPGRRLTGESSDDTELKKDPSLAVSYIVAPPRMSYYIEYSTRIYNVYLKYIAPEDMHVYSIDEVMIDASRYLGTYGITARELAVRIIRDIYHTTGITATAGIGSNLYLSKIAMDIVAKRSAPDRYGVRIAELDETSYRRLLWTHRPLTDFWRVGRGYARKLEENGLFTMGDIARCSLGSASDYYNEDLLYRLFGVNAELLIDHAWGYEPCTMADIKSYRPDTSSIVSGQVLQYPYTAEKARLVVREMADALALDLVEKGMVTGQLTLTVGYDIENLADPDTRRQYQGEVTVDRYGRRVPKHAHGTANLDRQTSSSLLITDAVAALYDRIINPRLLVRRISLSANRIVPASSVKEQEIYEQLDLFTDYAALRKEQEEEKRILEREQKMQKAMLEIKKKYGKNAILKGISLEEGATARERNRQIGGHKA
ncbi:MAG TPA: DNA methylase [Candidatus Choladocola avistercoris]|nr:DNA methylase [Candidatus Choladocola avistercoris]